MRMPTVSSITAEEFDARMTPLGPFEPGPLLAAAVSGGADSMALALLADTWARRAAARCLPWWWIMACRANSDAEAALTIQRLAARGIPPGCSAWTGLHHGPALAAASPRRPLRRPRAPPAPGRHPAPPARPPRRRPGRDRADAARQATAARPASPPCPPSPNNPGFACCGPCSASRRCACGQRCERPGSPGSRTRRTTISAPSAPACAPA